MNKVQQQPQFKELKFKTDSEFTTWLNKETHLIITFEDRGGDLLQMWIHSTGEILHANAHERLYNGTFIEMGVIESGKPLRIMDEKTGAFKNMGGLIVDKITFQKKKA